MSNLRGRVSGVAETGRTPCHQEEQQMARVVHFQEIGGPEVLRIEEIGAPAPPA